MRIGLAVVALMLASPGPAAAQEADMLGWLSGEWEAVTQEGPHVLSWTIENWSRPRGGVMLGTNLSGRRISSAFTMDASEAVRGFEYMRIARGESGVLTFHASPQGAAAVAFAMTHRGEQDVVFENPQNDYPQRIVYRRDGERLFATISLLDGSRPMSWTFSRRQQ